MWKCFVFVILFADIFCAEDSSLYNQQNDERIKRQLLQGVIGNIRKRIENVPVVGPITGCLTGITCELNVNSNFERRPHENVYPGSGYGNYGENNYNHGYHGNHGHHGYHGNHGPQGQSGNPEYYGNHGHYGNQGYGHHGNYGHQGPYGHGDYSNYGHEHCDHTGHHHEHSHGHNRGHHSGEDYNPYNEYMNQNNGGFNKPGGNRGKPHKNQRPGNHYGHLNPNNPHYHGNQGNFPNNYPDHPQGNQNNQHSGGNKFPSNKEDNSHNTDNINNSEIPNFNPGPNLNPVDMSHNTGQVNVNNNNHANQGGEGLNPESNIQKPGNLNNGNRHGTTNQEKEGQQPVRPNLDPFVNPPSRNQDSSTADPSELPIYDLDVRLGGEPGTEDKKTETKEPAVSSRKKRDIKRINSESEIKSNINQHKGAISTQRQSKSLSSLDVHAESNGNFNASKVYLVRNERDIENKKENAVGKDAVEKINTRIINTGVDPNFFYGNNDVYWHPGNYYHPYFGFYGNPGIPFHRPKTSEKLIFSGNDKENEKISENTKNDFNVPNYNEHIQDFNPNSENFYQPHAQYFHPHYYPQYHNPYDVTRLSPVSLYKCVDEPDAKYECVPMSTCQMSMPRGKRRYCKWHDDEPHVCCKQQQGTTIDYSNVELLDEPVFTRKPDLVCGRLANNGMHRVLTAVVGATPLRTASTTPWMVAIGERTRRKGSDTINWYCGGTLVGPRTVVTAAHCMTQKKPLLVRVGELDFSSNFEPSSPMDIKIENTIPHPDYKSPMYYNDIGVVKLARPVMYNEFIRPICLPPPNDKNTHDGSLGILTGWGQVRFGGERSPVLQEVSVEVFNNSYCNELYRKASSLNVNYPEGIISSQLCAGDEKGGKDACQGDSGGPLIVKEDGVHTLIGIVSSGVGCGSVKFPGVYTRVSSFVEWLEQYLDK